MVLEKNWQHFPLPHGLVVWCLSRQSSFVTGIAMSCMYQGSFGYDGLAALQLQHGRS